MALHRLVLLFTGIFVASFVATPGTVLQIDAQQGGDACAVDLTTCTPLTLPSQQPPSDLWVNQCYQVQSNAQPLRIRPRQRGGGWSARFRR